MSAIQRTTVVTAAGTGGVEAALAHRANILEMTQGAEDAVLSPRDTGAFGHDVRAALAARMARLDAEEALARTFEARMDRRDVEALAHPSHDGAGTPHETLLSFVDKAAASPKDIAETDIARLKAAGMADADIVRLCELIAFLAYEIRLIAGLRLLAGSPS